MLTEPNINKNALIELLKTQYALDNPQLTFLALGADPHTYTYKVQDDQATYFLKLRSANFSEVSLALPAFLKKLGAPHIVAPIETTDKTLWSHLDTFTCILYPYVMGTPANEALLTPAQWNSFGDTLKHIHDVEIPNYLRRMLTTEKYASIWTDALRVYLSELESATFKDEISQELVAFMHEKIAEVTTLVETVERLALQMKELRLNPVLCHGDLYAGNLLVTNTDEFFIIDWDTACLAPKERDLMHIGGGVMHVWNTAEEVDAFYKGYGQGNVNRPALKYYRNARIVEDIAVSIHEIISEEVPAQDRKRNLGFLKDNFTSGGVLDIAKQT